jgi:hypothetical protein
MTRERRFDLTDRQILTVDAASVAFVCFLVLAFALPGFLTKLLCGIAAVFAALIIVAVRAGS